MCTCSVSEKPFYQFPELIVAIKHSNYRMFSFHVMKIYLNLFKWIRLKVGQVDLQWFLLDPAVKYKQISRHSDTFLLLKRANEQTNEFNKEFKHEIVLKKSFQLGTYQ